MPGAGLAVLSGYKAHRVPGRQPISGEMEGPGDMRGSLFQGESVMIWQDSNQGLVWPCQDTPGKCQPWVQEGEMLVEAVPPVRLLPSA